MRKLICLLLVVVLCMNLAGVAFASAVKSPGQGGEAPTVPDETGGQPTGPEGEGTTATGPDGDDTTPTNPGEEPPKTGDRSMIGLWLLLMILALIAMIVILRLDYKYMRN